MSSVAKPAVAGLFLVIISNLCLAQNIDSASSYIAAAKAAAKSNYDELMQDQLGVFNGIEYVNYDLGISGNPFFPDDYYENGTIQFDDEIYYNIPLKYDVVEDKVLIEYFNHAGYRRGLVLENEKIGFFKFKEHSFVKIDENHPIGSLKHGFYEILLDEEIGIYASRRKSIDRKMENGSMRIRFLAGDQYFVHFADNTYKVTGKSSVLKLYRDQKKALKKYIKSNRLDLRRNFEEALIPVTRHYIKVRQRNETF